MLPAGTNIGSGNGLLPAGTNIGSGNGLLPAGTNIGSGNGLLPAGTNIGSGNGLLPAGTKQLPEPMLTCYEWGSVSFTRGNFAGVLKISIHVKLSRNYTFELLPHLPGAIELTCWGRSTHTNCLAPIQTIINYLGQCWLIDNWVLRNGLECQNESCYVFQCQPRS